MVGRDGLAQNMNMNTPALPDIANQTLDEVCVTLKPFGMYCYREHFPFGYCPAFRGPNGYAFLWRGKLITGDELARDLRDWKPASAKDQEWKRVNIEPLQAL